MIVLDEQLLGRDLEREIAKWHPGAVCFITDLRPGSVIKDDAIPKLLLQEKQPIFITINERDFWRKIPSIRNSALFVSRCQILVQTKFLPDYGHYSNIHYSIQIPREWEPQFESQSKVSAITQLNGKQ